MNDDLIVGLLRDVHATQLSQAETLGSLSANMKILAENKPALEKRVTALERKGWKETGFFAGFLVLGEPIFHYVAKKWGF